jgi:5-methylcytosine-specific restriction endonuclease McrA
MEQFQPTCPELAGRVEVQHPSPSKPLLERMDSLAAGPRAVPERILLRRAARRRWRDKNPDYGRKWEQEYSRKNPEIYRAKTKEKNDLRANKKKAGDKRLNKIISQWRTEPSFYCYYCQKQFPTQELQVDHIVPYSKGGNHATDNVCKACSKCNESKGELSLSELIFCGQLLLSL